MLSLQENGRIYWSHLKQWQAGSQFIEFGVVKVWGELVLAMQSKEVLLGWHDSFVGKRRANPKDGPTFNYVKTI